MRVFEMGAPVLHPVGIAELLDRGREVHIPATHGRHAQERVAGRVFDPDVASKRKFLDRLRLLAKNRCCLGRERRKVLGCGEVRRGDLEQSVEKPVRAVVVPVNISRSSAET